MWVCGNPGVKEGSRTHGVPLEECVWDTSGGIQDESRAAGWRRGTGWDRDTGWVHGLIVGLQDELRDTEWPWECRRGCGLWTWAPIGHQVSSGHLQSCEERRLQAGDDERVRGLQTGAPKD